MQMELKDLMKSGDSSLESFLKMLMEKIENKDIKFHQWSKWLRENNGLIILMKTKTNEDDEQFEEVVTSFIGGEFLENGNHIPKLFKTMHSKKGLDNEVKYARSWGQALINHESFINPL